eukprot:gene14199-biopygen21622
MRPGKSRTCRPRATHPSIHRHPKRTRKRKRNKVCAGAHLSFVYVWDVSGWTDEWRCAGGGGGSGHFRDSPGRIPARKSAPRAARPLPPAARPGRMGPEVGPAFQRRSRPTLSCILGVRLRHAAFSTAARARSRRGNDTDGLWE